MGHTDRKRFVVGLDLDGVVFDYVDAFAEVVSLCKGVPVAEIPEPREWDFVAAGWPIDSQEEFLELHRYGVVHRAMFLTGDEIPGASDGVWRLNDAEIEPRIVTHRLITHGDHPTVISDTVRWLSMLRPDGRPRVPARSYAFYEDKEQAGADVYVDDAPHKVTQLRQAGRPTIVFNQPYNQELPGPRAHNWFELTEMIQEFADSAGKLADKGVA